MKSRIMRVVLLFGVTVGLLATAAPPASATTIKNGTFVGTAELSRGLGYPCILPVPPDPNCLVNEVGNIGTKTDPKNLPGQPTYNPDPTSGNTAGFGFGTIACVDEGVAVGKPKTPATAGPCAIGAAGTVTGYCGLSTGTGTATYTSSNGSTYGTMIKFTGVGGTLYVTGGNKQTNIRAVVEAVPVPGIPTLGPSCTTKTQQSFIIAGDFTYKDCTATLPCPPL